ncbi:heme peroxidase family protein [Pararoseomonas sp. SCSIO 73927]|uniref:peroxidase family protein n=1 Tax=Pararoseomonas sp. SCSIO 73927 TaxID=3114537 RepID=UPI0030D4A3B8
MSNELGKNSLAENIARPLIRHGSPLRGGIAVPAPGLGFRAGRFGRLFPELKALDVPEAALVALGEAMVEGGANQTGDNPNIPAGFTYLGQFIDHDITLDTTGIAERIKDVDQVVNFRTPRLDLDCVYGMGPGASPQLYDRRKSTPALSSARMLLGRTVAGFVGRDVQGGLEFDLPRGIQGRALIGDHRNDENLLVAQTHVAFLLFHNAIARSRPELDFAQVRQQVTWHYQWMVLHDFLGKLVDMNDIATSLRKREFYRFEDLSLYREPYIPVEFSVAAYRLGHSMVRGNYSHNRVFPDQPFLRSFVFSGLSGNIIGELAADQANAPISGEPAVPALPSDWINDWRQFFDFGTDEGQQDGLARNRSRLIDPYLVQALHDLPGGRKGPGIDLGSHPSLAVRNLARGAKMMLPSGQDVARHMRIAPLTGREITSSGDDGKVAERHGLHERTPLWYYVLKEAQIRQRGERLGPVGSRILAEVFVGLLEGDPESFVAQNEGWTLESPTWRPTIGEHPGSFSMTDLLRFAFGSKGAGGDVALSPVDVAANLQAPQPAP